MQRGTVRFAQMSCWLGLAQLNGWLLHLKRDMRQLNVFFNTIFMLQRPSCCLREAAPGQTMNVLLGAWYKGSSRNSARGPVEASLVASGVLQQAQGRPSNAADRRTARGSAVYMSNIPLENANFRIMIGGREL
jgi:hypothetical protein